MLAKHCTILNINCYKELNHCEMQGAIYFKILIWGPSYSWLEWTKKPAGYNLPPKMFCTIFPLKKNICLACLWGKNILPLRNLSTPQLLCQIRIGNFVTCVPSNCSYPINLEVPAKIECNMNKVYPCLYSSVSLINIMICIPTYKNF